MDIEKFVKEYLPFIRKILAKTLYIKYNLTQSEIAKKLNISQATISYYLSEKRGVKELELNEKVTELIENFARAVAFRKNVSKKELEEFYDELRKSL